jgi:hypothetical protein
MKTARLRELSDMLPHMSDCGIKLMCSHMSKKDIITLALFVPMRRKMKSVGAPTPQVKLQEVSKVRCISALLTMKEAREFGSTFKEIHQVVNLLVS